MEHHRQTNNSIKDLTKLPGRATYESGNYEFHSRLEVQTHALYQPLNVTLVTESCRLQVEGHGRQAVVRPFAAKRKSRGLAYHLQ
jgi:hypothetical protein